MLRVSPLDLRIDRPWRLPDARAAATSLLSANDARPAVRQLLRALAADREQRVRAADVLRRVTEKDSASLLPYANALATLLSEVPLEEKRARWHLGLVVARTARTSAQRATAAELLWRLSEDESNVVRCSAVEGLGLLALHDANLCNRVEPYLRHALATGTCAMQVRARRALQRLDRADQRAQGRR